MLTKTERFAPLTEVEAKAAVPVDFTVGPDAPGEMGAVTVVAVIPRRTERVRVVQTPMDDSFETTMCWVGDGREVEFDTEEARDALDALVDRAGAAYAQIVYSGDTFAEVIEAIKPDEPVDFDSPAMRHEHMVPVVFDVLAPDRRRAAEVVAGVLALAEGSGLRQAFDRVNKSGTNTMVEAWWFPEASDKPVDHNDRPDMWLQEGSEAEVRASECEEIRGLLQREEDLPDGVVESLSDALDKRAEQLREGGHAVV